MKTILLAALLAAPMGQAMTASESKIGPNLLKAMHQFNEGVDILIYMNSQADLSSARAFQQKSKKSEFVFNSLVEHAKFSQKELRDYLASESIKYQSFYLGNIIHAFNVDSAKINEIAARKDVLKVLGNPYVQSVAPPTPQQLAPSFDTESGIGSNITHTGADRVWNEYNTKGEGIVIAGQDTGVQWDHPALKNQYRGWDGATASHDYNWNDAIHSGRNNRCSANHRFPCDDHGHGTHTIGTAIGSDGGSNQIGVAPEAKWIACRNMNEGYGTPATYLECFQFFLAPWPFGGDPEDDGRPELGADVMNNSWGCPQSEGCEGDEFEQVLHALKEAGIMVVASAGNEGSGCQTIGSQPASHGDTTFSVGSINHSSNSISSFSSRGPSAFDGSVGPDITAPGENIRSATPGNNYASWGWSGTSMAGPHVAGAVALLWSAKPELKGNIDATIALFTQNAVATRSNQSCDGRSGSQIPNNTFGHGILNIYDVVQSALRD